MIKYSRYNIFSKIRDSGNYFILNLLTGNADILTPDEAEKIYKVRDEQNYSPSSLTDNMTEKGYLIDDEKESSLYRSKYLDHLDTREKEDVQLFFITNYTCNFACSYCYQDQYKNPAPELNTEVIDSFFNYINSAFAAKNKYITVFGGEPLQGNPKQKKLISYLLERANNLKIDVCFVTNGYTLNEYIDILRNGGIREIQVTLDGTGSTHNKRRFLKGGGGTFDKIVSGIDACLQNSIPVNLRMVIDKENIDNLHELAQFAIDRGWTNNSLFKSQIGRNYELHHCQSAPDKLFNRISLYEKIYDLIAQYPHVLQFYKPAYSVSKFLSENGNLPDPLFDSCPACKTEWAFDYTGNIYPCTATVGKADESLGTFYPLVNLITEKTDQWESRDVTSISECRDCSLQLACGGGCGSLAKNNKGSVNSADCRPVKELLELGFAAYFPDTK